MFALLYAQVNIEIYLGKTLNHLLGFVRETRVDVVHFQRRFTHTRTYLFKYAPICIELKNTNSFAVN